MGLGMCVDASVASAGVGTFCLNAGSSCQQQEGATAAAHIHRPGSPLPYERRRAGGPGGSWEGSSSTGGSSSSSHAHHMYQEQRHRQPHLNRLVGGWRGRSDGGEPLHSAAAGSGLFYEAAAGAGGGPGSEPASEADSDRTSLDLQHQPRQYRGSGVPAEAAAAAGGGGDGFGSRLAGDDLHSWGSDFAPLAGSVQAQDRLSAASGADAGNPRNSSSRWLQQGGGEEPLSVVRGRAAQQRQVMSISGWVVFA
eukprot:gene9725-9885_t